MDKSVLAAFSACFFLFGVWIMWGVHLGIFKKKISSAEDVKKLMGKDRWEQLLMEPVVSLSSTQFHQLMRNDFGDGVNNPDNLRVMLLMRLRLRDGMHLPLEHVHTVRTNDKVVVFAIQRGEPLIIEDDWALYPSDTLLTKLRLLL